MSSCSSFYIPSYFQSTQKTNESNFHILKQEHSMAEHDKHRQAISANLLHCVTLTLSGQFLCIVQLPMAMHMHTNFQDYAPDKSDACLPQVIP